MARYKGLEQVVFEGIESLPSSKFNIILDLLKKRIDEEISTYSEDEQEHCYFLVDVADKLRMLFQSQDTPLYSTQNTMNVNAIANEMVLEVQEPLGMNNLPNEERRLYTDLLRQIMEQEVLRGQLWNEYITLESFNRGVDYTDMFSATCLMGIGSRTRKNLENLASFNRMVAERFNLMRTNIGDDNAYKVNYLLDYVPKLEQAYEEMYPEKARERAGKYERIFSEERNNINERQSEKLAYIVNHLKELQR